MMNFEILFNESDEHYLLIVMLVCMYNVWLSLTSFKIWHGCIIGTSRGGKPHNNKHHQFPHPRTWYCSFSCWAHLVYMIPKMIRHSASCQILYVNCCFIQGSYPTWKTGNFVIFFSRPGKCLEFAQKVVKTWTFNSKPGKKLKFANSIFQASLFKMSFTKIILVYFFCHIYIINT